MRQQLKNPTSLLQSKWRCVWTMQRCKQHQILPPSLHSRNGLSQKPVGTKLVDRPCPLALVAANHSRGCIISLKQSPCVAKKRNVHVNSCLVELNTFQRLFAFFKPLLLVAAIEINCASQEPKSSSYFICAKFVSAPTKLVAAPIAKNVLLNFALHVSLLPCWASTVIQPTRKNN